MKRIITFLLIISALTVKAQVPLAGEITTIGASDTYPLLQDTLLRGGYQTVYSKAVRDAIPAARRKQGMMVRVSSLDSTYVLSGGISNANWIPFSSGITASVLSDSLSNYAKIEDGLINGGVATTTGDSLLVDEGLARINSTNIFFTGRLFADISPSGVGLTRILIIYANTSGDLDSIAGAQSNNPVEPTIPSNTVRVVTVNVSDAGLGVPSVDLSGYAKLVGGNVFSGDQVINDTLFFIKNTDEWKQYVLGNTDTPSGDLVFQSGDNGEEGFIFKSKANSPIFGFSDSTFLKIKYPQIDLKLNSKFFGKAEYNSDLSGTYTTRSLIDKGYADLTYQNKLSGTTNFIPKFTGVSTLGNSLIIDDGTNVGVGGSPVYTFDVQKSGTSIIASRGTTQSVIRSETGAVALDMTTFGTVGTIRTATNHPMILGANATDILTINTNGTSVFSNTVQATRLGAGIAPNANFGFTGAASTSTTAPFLITPGVAYTGTQNGALHYVSADSTLRMYRFNSSDQFLFNNNNKFLKGLVGTLFTNGTGGISVAPLAPYIDGNRIAVTTNRTITTADYGENGNLFLNVNATSGAVVITLPSLANMAGINIRVTREDNSGNSITIQGAVNINGASTFALTSQWQSVDITAGTSVYLAK
jgi:hypothetical protein